MRIMRNIFRTRKTGNSLIAIVNKNSTGLVINTIASHKISMQSDVALLSVKIFKLSISIEFFFFNRSIE